MRRKIWYYYVRFYLKTTLGFFYKNFDVVGTENIPRKRAVIFVPNHVNTFLDATIVAVCTSRMSHHMARADVFKNPKLTWLMATVNLRPIYRLRDGKDAVGKNEQVFIMLQDYMKQGECVTLHPEGTHTLDHRVRNFKKGFTRLAFGYLDRFPNEEVDIIPVGLNYDNPTEYRSNISVHFGKPIDARPYYEMEDQNKAAQELTNDAYQGILPLLTNIDDAENYDEIFKKLKATGADLTKPEECNPIIEKLKTGETVAPIRKKTKAGILTKALYPFAIANNWLAVILWKKMKPTFKDPAWHGPMKYALGLSVVPIMYIIQTLVVMAFFGWVWALIYLFFSFLTVPAISIGQKATRA